VSGRLQAAAFVCASILFLPLSLFPGAARADFAPAASCATVAAYQELQQALVQRQPERVDLDAAKCLIPDPRQYTTFVRHLETAQVLETSWWQHKTWRAGCWLGFECVDHWREAYRVFNMRAGHFSVAIEYLAKALAENLRDAAAQPRERGDLLAWQGADLAMAATELLRRTESPEVAALLAGYFDGVLALRDSVLGQAETRRGRPVAAWSNQARDGGRAATVTLAGRITFPMLDYAGIILRNGKLAGFRARSRRYIRDSAKALDEFDQDWKPLDGGRYHYYVKSGTETAEPISHAHAAGNSLLYLYAYTRDARYKRKIEDIIKVFMATARPESNGSLSWSYYPVWCNAGARQPSELMWQAAVTTPFLYRAYKVGAFVDAETIKKIRITFLRNILLDEGLNARVSIRDKRPINVNEEAKRAQSFFPWAQLFSDASIPAFADVMTEYPGIYPNGWLSSGKTFFVYARMINASDLRRPRAPMARRNAFRNDRQRLSSRS